MSLRGNSRSNPANAASSTGLLRRRTPRNDTNIVAITGGIATGKSTFAKRMRSEGFPVIDTDRIAHTLLASAPVKKRVAKLFGTSSRTALAKIVFADVKKLRTLEKLLHPLIIKETKKQIRVLKKKRPEFIFVEVPLLFEAGLEKMFDVIIVVACSKTEQLKRLTKKFGWKRKDALRRIRSQLPLEKKMRKADMVVWSK